MKTQLARWSIIRRVLVRMIGFIISCVANSLVITLTHRQYSAISALYQIQITVAHALGFLSLHKSFPSNGSRRSNCNSLTLQILHVSLLFTEAFFTTRAGN
jgi:hypothetical protein